jgi:hypothetical protein
MIRSDPLKVCAYIAAALLFLSTGCRLYGYAELSLWLFWTGLVLACSAVITMKYGRR